jgi:hypothetical protein
MSYAPYKNSYTKESNFGIPERSLNGGLYTGEPFKDGAAYANVPAIPDAGYLIHYNLRSADPPSDALYQYPGTDRPGNNTALFPGVQQWKQGKYGLACVDKVVNVAHVRDCDCQSCTMSKYAYL